ncbi:MAG: hypothetical protein ACRBM6_04390 [Geminicoccales bacterium]
MEQSPRISILPVGLRVFGFTFLALAAMLVMAASFSTNSAFAQQASDVRKLECASHDKVTNFLDSKHTETPVSLGLATDGKVLEVFSTEDGETWTVVMTAPEGVSCIVATGKYWQDLPTKPKGPAV